MNAVLTKSPDSSSGPFNSAAPPYGDDPTNRLIAAARHNDIPNMQFAIAQGANKYGVSSSGENIYTAAAAGNALSAIDFAVRELEAWIEAADRKGRTGLLVALEETHPHAAMKFLSYGANPLTVGKTEGYSVRHCFRTLEAALHRDDAVQGKRINEIWSPVVGGMVHRLFNPESYPDDNGVVWTMHIPPFIQGLTLSSGATIKDMYEERHAKYLEIKAARFQPTELNP
jgi:hypothetical protein